MMDPIQFLGVMQQDMEHQRQVMEVVQQMQQQVRQMQHQEQQAHEAQTQQGAPPSGGNERQSQQLILKGFDNIETFSGGEEQWQNWSWKIKTAISGMNGELANRHFSNESGSLESQYEELLKSADNPGPDHFDAIGQWVANLRPARVKWNFFTQVGECRHMFSNLFEKASALTPHRSVRTSTALTVIWDRFSLPVSPEPKGDFEHTQQFREYLSLSFSRR